MHQAEGTQVHDPEMGTGPARLRNSKEARALEQSMGGEYEKMPLEGGPQCQSDHLLGLAYVPNILLGTLSLFSSDSHK